jgi:hypothetical protein
MPTVNDLTDRGADNATANAKTLIVLLGFCVNDGLTSTLFQAASFTHGVPQEVLDLAVDAAQLVVCPPPNGVEYLRIDSQQERGTLCHASHSFFWHP